MTFRALILFLADRIGQHQIPVHPGAHEIRHFLGADGVHHDLISRTVRQLYKANHCGHLDARISGPTTLATLAAIRTELSRCIKTDIDQYKLIDSLCATTSEFLAEYSEAEITRTPPTPIKDNTATVVELSSGHRASSPSV
ncbi:MAG: hypothetical protein GXP09_09635 [Gammaproteobacteria bacterium]|nr:hypothetical protein [Gammaproteobacteria bacterium]